MVLRVRREALEIPRCTSQTALPHLQTLDFVVIAMFQSVLHKTIYVECHICVLYTPANDLLDFTFVDLDELQRRSLEFYNDFAIAFFDVPNICTYSIIRMRNRLSPF